MLLLPEISSPAVKPAARRTCTALSNKGSESNMDVCCLKNNK